MQKLLFWFDRFIAVAPRLCVVAAALAIVPYGPTIPGWLKWLGLCYAAVAVGGAASVAGVMVGASFRPAASNRQPGADGAIGFVTSWTAPPCIAVSLFVYLGVTALGLGPYVALRSCAVVGAVLAVPIAAWTARL